MLLLFIVFLDADSTNVDSSTTYEIPEIVMLGNDIEYHDKILSASQYVLPTFYNLDLGMAIYNTSITSQQKGFGQSLIIYQRDQNAQYTKTNINYHTVSNPFFGYTDLSDLPIQFADAIILTDNIIYGRGLNIITKLNHYEQPFSSVSFSTGSYGMNLYNADLSRPITDDLGFYAAGLHLYGRGHRANSDYRTSAFYINTYSNYLLPARLDLVYTSQTAGFPGDNQDTLNGSLEQEFIDACLCSGSDQNKCALYFSRDNNILTIPYLTLENENSVNNIGLRFTNRSRFCSVDMKSLFEGSMSIIHSDLYDTQNLYTSRFIVTSTKNHKRLVLSLTSVFELYDTDAFYYKPHLQFGLHVIDSIYVIAEVYRQFRRPAIVETHQPNSAYIFYPLIIGNPDLKDEKYWVQEINLRNKELYVALYKHDYRDRITERPLAADQYEPYNIDTWQTIGIQGSFRTSLVLQQSSDRKGKILVRIGYGGNYIFKGSSLPLIAPGYSNMQIALERTTDRFTIGVELNERFLDTREDYAGEVIESFRDFSATAYLRFLDLHLALACNNILDEDYVLLPDYAMTPRNFNFTLRWNFWN